MLSTEKFISEVSKRVKKAPKKTCWQKGVILYANDLLSELQEGLQDKYIDLDSLRSPAVLEKSLLNGAVSWDQYSSGGCSLCYNSEIAKRLCTKKQLLDSDCGMFVPNAWETWIQVQARALTQAACLIRAAVSDVFNREDQKNAVSL